MLRPLRLRERPKRAQAPPQERPKTPKRAPRSPKRLPEAPRGSPGAPLQLSWGSLGALLSNLYASQTSVLLKQNQGLRKWRILIIKYHRKLNVQKPLSSSYRICATVERELQNEGARGLFPMLRQLRWDKHRNCTCLKVSFIEVKRWVMKSHQKSTKNDYARSRKTYG